MGGIHWLMLHPQDSAIPNNTCLVCSVISFYFDCRIGGTCEEPNMKTSEGGSRGQLPSGFNAAILCCDRPMGLVVTVDLYECR